MGDTNFEEAEVRMESENDDDNDVNVISTDHLTDPGWKHGTAVTANKKKVRCNYCGKILSGGIHRLKQHLAKLPGEAAICKKVSDDVCQSMKKVLLEKTSKSDMRKKLKRSLGVFGRTEEETLENVSDSIDSPSQGLTKRCNQRLITTAFDKDARKKVCEVVARWFYHAAIPFNAADSVFFPMACEAIGSYGPSFKPPTPYELGGPLLEGEVLTMNNYLNDFKASWAKTGCTIMSDGWKDQKGRTLINFLVSCPRGTMFLKCVDASSIEKNAHNLFEMLDGVVEEVGEENIVQIVTDNASNYVAAGRYLMRKRKHLYWTPCGAHCIDLILEKIGTLKRMDDLINKSKKFAKFIYNHSWVLDLMRSFTDGKEIVRPGVTRFATNFILIKSLLDQKSALKKMFVSEEWTGSKFAHLEEGREAEDIVLDNYFWRKMEIAQKIIEPLVQALKMADGDDKPSMGYMYDVMERAKLKIAEVCGNDPTQYKDIWEIIDRRVEQKLHLALHLAGYYLNPSIRYRADFSEDMDIRRGLQDAINVLEWDEDKKIDAIDEIKMFEDAAGMFGSQLAIASRARMSPVSWWESFGMDAPNLRRIAIRILSQTCSASGCERNWSTFDQIYTKKRNQLKQKKLTSLVYIHYNLRLRERHLRRHGSSYDPINLNNILLKDNCDEWLEDVDTVDGLDTEDLIFDLNQHGSQVVFNTTQSASTSTNPLDPSFGLGGMGSFTNLLHSQFRS